MLARSIDDGSVDHVIHDCHDLTVPEVQLRAASAVGTGRAGEEAGPSLREPRMEDAPGDIQWEPIMRSPGWVDGWRQRCLIDPPTPRAGSGAHRSRSPYGAA